MANLVLDNNRSLSHAIQAAQSNTENNRNVAAQRSNSIVDALAKQYAVDSAQANELLKNGGLNNPNTKQAYIDILNAQAKRSEMINQQIDPRSNVQMQDGTWRAVDPSSGFQNMQRNESVLGSLNPGYNASRTYYENYIPFHFQPRPILQTPRSRVTPPPSRGMPLPENPSTSKLMQLLQQTYQGF